MNALIVDDEIDVCYLLSSLLRSNSIETNFANTILEAKLALEKQCPDIIFLDNHLPDGMGVDFISHIKQHCSSSRIIMITAYASLADEKQALTEGADIFIAKPFTRDIINQAVHNVTH